MAGWPLHGSKSNVSDLTIRAGRPRPLWLQGWGWLPLTGLALTLFFIAVAAFGPWLMTHDPQGYSFYLNELPSSTYWLGTDSTGQDIYSRLILGTRLSLGVGAASALVALGIGAGLAIVAMALGPWAEAIVFALVDLIRALPGVLFALALIVALEPGVTSVVIALGRGLFALFRPHHQSHLRSGNGAPLHAGGKGAGCLAAPRRAAPRGPEHRRRADHPVHHHPAALHRLRGGAVVSGARCLSRSADLGADDLERGALSSRKRRTLR